MEKFAVSELLRYATIGIFFILLNYLLLNPQVLAQQVALVLLGYYFAFFVSSMTADPI